MDIEKKAQEPEEDDGKPTRDMPVNMEPPHVRFNAQLAVQDDVLYIYGGTFEKGDREFTFDDLYAIDLDKLNGCKEIFNRPVEDWIVSFCWLFFVCPSPHRDLLTGDQESEDEEEDDDDDDDEEGDYQEDEEDEDQEDGSEQLQTPSKRKKQRQEESSEASSEASSTSIEDDDTVTTATSVDDGLPHPRVRLFSSFFFSVSLRH
jgi:hypothetical protein